MKEAPSIETPTSVRPRTPLSPAPYWAPTPSAAGSRKLLENTMSTTTGRVMGSEERIISEAVTSSPSTAARRITLTSCGVRTIRPVMKKTLNARQVRMDI